MLTLILRLGFSFLPPFSFLGLTYLGLEPASSPFPYDPLSQLSQLVGHADVGVHLLNLYTLLPTLKPFPLPPFFTPLNAEIEDACQHALERCNPTS